MPLKMGFWGVKFSRGVRGNEQKEMRLTIIWFDNSYIFFTTFNLDAYTHMATSDGAQVSFHVSVNAR